MNGGYGTIYAKIAVSRYFHIIFKVVGREIMLYLIALLCENYGKNRYLTNLVNNVRIHIMPSINPDGYELGNEGDRSGFTVSCVLIITYLRLIRGPS